MRLLISERGKRADLKDLLSKARKLDIRVLHLLKLEVDEEIGNLLAEFLKSQSSCRGWQRIQLERCTGVGLQIVMQAVFSVSVERVIWNSKNFPTVCLSSIDDSSDSQKKHSSLQSLELHSVRLNVGNARFLKQALYQYKNIMALKLIECDLEDMEVASIIAQGLQQQNSLQSLNLSKCNIDDSTTAMFLEALKDSDNLKELDLSWTQCGEAAVRALSSLLEASTSLTKLHLANVFLMPPENQSPDTTNHIAVLAKAIERNSSLACLTLPGNDLDNSDLQALAFALTRNSTLKTLQLQDNNIDDHAISHILSVWQQWSSLHSLWLFGNPALGIEGIEQLTAAFPLQTQLQDLQFPTLGPNYKRLMQCQREVQYWGDLNKAGRRLLLQEVPLGVWPLVFARANRLNQQNSVSFLGKSTQGFSSANAIYHLLRGPVMFQKR
jgi:Ran GTPase-activating protein (RanGAP) involved in mRNA processing and transport